MDKKINIVIIGGGFGGIRAALDLDRKLRRRIRSGNVRITLISTANHFEFTPSLHKIATGRNPAHVCVPLRDIFGPTGVDVVPDTIAGIDPEKKIAKGISGQEYPYDYLVVAVGSETTYYNIPGLKELSFGFKTITEAIRLKQHLHEVFASCENVTKAEKLCHVHIVIVGGGASGTELAGEMADYGKVLAKKHGVDPTLVTVDLVEAGPRLVAALPEEMSRRIEQRLRSLGVNIFLNRAVEKEALENVYLKDMQLKTKTLIWAAGVTVNPLCTGMKGLEYDKYNRIVVDEYLRPKGYEDNTFVIGDIASTPYSGLAQTAIHHGSLAAENIVRLTKKRPLMPYVPKEPGYIISLNSRWAAARVNGMQLYGMPAVLLRKAVDLRFFFTILPPGKALTAFQEEGSLCETCEICVPGSGDAIA